MLKKSFTIFLTGIMLLAGAQQTVLAKSSYMIGQNMSYRRTIVMEPAFKTYTRSEPENYVYYGAKFEPRAGIYIGTPYNRQYPGIDNAINTEYDWFVPSEEIDNNHVARVELAETKSEHKTLRGYNWNFSLKGDKVINIKDYSNYIYNKIDEIAARGEDTLLIFGKEMNIDENFNDPELFKTCFRFVADYAHTKENIAMVWAPNDTGGLDTTLEEYYPGDEYTDWIGCSMYTMPFFQGNPNNSDSAQMSFVMGRYANPSIRAKLIHDFLVKNNIQKPVFITEGGVGYESPSGVDYTDWAKLQLRMYYTDICRAYPEFKCIVSFNHFIYPGDLYRYDIAEKPELLGLLQELTGDPVYLKQYPSSAPYAYKELSDGTVFSGAIEVSSYAYVPTIQSLIVRYLIDGQWVAERSEPPYEVRLTSNDVTYGSHVLTCEIWDGRTVSAKNNYNITFIPADDDYSYSDELFTGKCRFRDMTGTSAEMRNAAELLASEGIINGLDGKNLAPDKKISRAETATILVKILGLSESDVSAGFKDVGKDNWYYGIVNSAVKEGIISGYDDNTFRGENAVTRNEFITLIAEILKNKEKAEVPDIELSYSDNIAGWVEDYVKITKNKGLILERNDNLFSGTTEVKRGDAVVMACRLYKELYGKK